MQLPNPLSLEARIAIFVLMPLAAVACVAIWLSVAARLARGQQILPCEARRPVPWRGRDVALVFLLYFLPVLSSLTASWFFHAEGVARPVAAAEKDVAHPVLVLLRSSPSVSILLFCIFTVVVVAPVAEEVLFRLLLQGWLEKVDSAARWRHRFWPRVRAFWPVVMTSVLFASLHFRTAQPQLKADEILAVLVLHAAWNLVTLVAAVGWLRFECRATWADLGVVPSRLLSDFRMGLLAFLAVAAPIYVLQASLQWMLKAVAADPITLTFFALVLGVLYFRTHRLVPSIVLHMALNGTSLAIAWLLGG